MPLLFPSTKCVTLSIICDTPDMSLDGWQLQLYGVSFNVMQSLLSLIIKQTYVMFDQVFWRGTAGQINRWRRNTLGLPSTSLDKMEPHKIPFLYNFSPTVVPAPLDWPEWIRITGLHYLTFCLFFTDRIQGTGSWTMLMSGPRNGNPLRI
jgi:hypothetical protein